MAVAAGVEVEVEAALDEAAAPASLCFFFLCEGRGTVGTSDVAAVAVSVAVGVGSTGIAVATGVVVGEPDESAVVGGGSFVTGGGTSRLTVVDVCAALARGLVRCQRSTSTIAIAATSANAKMPSESPGERPREEARASSTSAGGGALWGHPGEGGSEGAAGGAATIGGCEGMGGRLSGGRGPYAGVDARPGAGTGEGGGGAPSAAGSGADVNAVLPPASGTVAGGMGERRGEAEGKRGDLIGAGAPAAGGEDVAAGDAGGVGAGSVATITRGNGSCGGEGEGAIMGDGDVAGNGIGESAPAGAPAGGAGVRSFGGGTGVLLLGGGSVRSFGAGGTGVGDLAGGGCESRPKRFVVGGGSSNASGRIDSMRTVSGGGRSGVLG